MCVGQAAQDPLMAYYPSIKDILFKVATSKSERTVTALYSQILSCLTNQTELLEYTEHSENRSKMAEMVFYEESLTDTLLRCALDSPKTLLIMLEIVRELLERKKEVLFVKYVPIFEACSHHPQSVEVSSAAA